MAGLKVATNMGTTVENAYTVNQPESVRQRRKTGVFVETASETPYCTISVNPGIVASLHASAHHPYTTLATGQ